MPQELVAHPETGQPSLVETNYIPVERQQLQDKLDADQAAADAVKLGCPVNRALTENLTAGGGTTIVNKIYAIMD